MALKNSKLRVGLIVLNVVALVGLSGLVVYLYQDREDVKEVLSLTTEEKNQRLVDEINEVYDLPDEEPVVAIVTSPDEFKKEYTAFENAESGDYLLFFRKARLNVLYRQSEKRVVKTTDVVVPISVELVGSQAAIDSAQADLADFGDQITVITKVDENIKQSFVFDIDSDQGAEAESIAKQLGYEIGSTLPSTIIPDAQTEIIIAVVETTPASPETE